MSKKQVYAKIISQTSLADGVFDMTLKAEEIAKEALRLAVHKLPIKCKIVSREALEGGDNSEN